MMRNIRWSRHASSKSRRAPRSVALGGWTLLAASVVLASCRTKGSDSAERSASGTLAPAVVEAAPDTSPASSTVPAAGPNASDANIAALVDEANAGDSALAAAALPKLSTPTARAFANLMLGEHHALHVQSMQVEQQQGITPQLPVPDPFKAAVEAEAGALPSVPRGEAYDSAYIAHEIRIHRAVIDWAGQPQNRPRNAAYRALLTRAAPVLQKHLDHALAAQRTLRHTVS